MSVTHIAEGNKRPAITTSAQPVPLLTTTDSTDSGDSRPASMPTLQTRTTGWHARTFDFDWGEPADRHRYQLKTGLPLLHATILNGDWVQAMALLSPEDLGLTWLAPASQRTPAGPQKTPHASRWASQLPSTNEETRRRAIIEMAIDVTGLTTLDHCSLHGANLLTLCLLLKVPSAVLDAMLSIACRHAPQYIHLPDANGRTPLGVAANSGRQEHVEKLLAAGAHPLATCTGGQSGRRTTPMEIAATEASTRIYMLMLGHFPALSIPDTTYPYAEDPSCLKAWLARHGTDDAIRLGDRFPALRGPLLCFKDKSGLSRLCRMIIEGTLINQLPPGLHEQVNWYRKHKVSLLALQGENSSPLLVAAEHSPVSVFFSLLAYGMEAITPQSNDEQSAWNAKKATGLRPTLSDSDSDVEISVESCSDSDPDAEAEVQRVPGMEHPEPALYIQALQHFIECRSASAIEKLQETLPAIRPLLADAASKLALAATASAIAAQQLPDNYRALMTRICRLLPKAQQMALIRLAATGTPEHLVFLLAVPNFPHGQDALLEALKFASYHHNREAFDIAAERSAIYRRKPRHLDSSLPVSKATFDHECLALQAGSKLWFDRFITAGLDLTAMLKTYGPDLVPMLADMDPAGLPSRLKGYRVKIDEKMIEAARTDEGRQALLSMRKAEGSKPAKA